MMSDTSTSNKKNLIPQSTVVSLSIAQNWFWSQPEEGSSHPAAAQIKQKLMFYEEARWQQSSEQLFLIVIQQRINEISPRAHVGTRFDNGKPSFLTNSHMAALLSGVT